MTVYHWRCQMLQLKHKLMVSMRPKGKGLFALQLLKRFLIAAPKMERKGSRFSDAKSLIYNVTSSQTILNAPVANQYIRPISVDQKSATTELKRIESKRDRSDSDSDSSRKRSSKSSRHHSKRYSSRSPSKRKHKHKRRSSSSSSDRSTYSKQSKSSHSSHKYDRYSKEKSRAHKSSRRSSRSRSHSSDRHSKRRHH